MKITIKEIALKNFLSVGNKWLTIDFREGLYRVTGENLDNNTRNGVGKSSIFCDGLMFALFGKPVRKISLPDIPNTINNKKSCEIKLVFDVEAKTYMIHRGIAPGFLILYENYVKGDEDKKNNKDEIQDSAKKLTQKRIDELVKANFNTFSHLLIMSNSYTSPFLDLDKNKKKEIIEDILGVSIFGEMCEVAKKQSLEILKPACEVSKKEYELSQANLRSIEENYKKLKQKSDEFDKEKKKQLKEIKDKLILINSSIKSSEESVEDESLLEGKVISLKTHVDLNNKKSTDISIELRLAQSSITEKTNILEKLKDEPVCPLCQTETSSDNITTYLHELEADVTNLKTVVLNKKKEKEHVQNKLDLINKKINEFNQQISDNKKLVRKLEDYKKEKERIREKVDEIKNKKNDFTELIDEDELNKKKQEITDIETKLEQLSLERNYYEYIRKMFSNEGIKNYIIKKILKFWNYKVNHYLGELNAEFSIIFDENLEATINSHHRDPLQYHSFSGGEKARIDVAILLSVIDISKLQNSIDLNVMVIDELLDGGLDDTGREDVLNLFNNMVTNQNKSIYVISHNTNLPTHLFKKEITLYKKNGFTTLEH